MEYNKFNFEKGKIGHKKGVISEQGDLTDGVHLT